MTVPSTRRRRKALLAMVLLLAAATPAMAQSAGGRGHRGGGGHGQATTAPAPDAPVLHPDPWPRLDAGALLCSTEDGLHQHQAAIAAQLDGRPAPAVQGCRVVTAMTPVTVVGRNGPAATEVRLPGQPGQVGWTDTALLQAPPPS